MEKLIKNKEIRKLAFGVVLFTTTIFLIFITAFVIIGDFSNKRKQEKLNEKVVQIFDLKYKLNKKNEKIKLYDVELDKINLVNQLKKQLNFILIDNHQFDVNNVDEDHLYFMETQRAEYGIPKHIYYRLIFAESGFRMYDNDGNVLRSNGGAMRYMQILESTFNWINNKYNLNLTDITNPYDNIIAGTFYLSKRKENIKKMFPNVNNKYKWKLIIASYNAGLEDVRKARGIPLKRYHTSNRFKYGDPNTETIAYVNFITKNFISDEKLLANL